MKNQLSVLQKNRLYLTIYFLCFLSFLVFWANTSKINGFLLLTPYHSDFLDYFFIVFTNFGNGLFCVLIIGALFWSRRYVYAWQLIAGFLLSGLIAQILKHFINSPRPKEFFYLKAPIHLIDGITHSGSASFPSGHTATAFMLATLFTFYSRNKNMGGLYLTLAVMEGYSRIYLSQHFPFDIMIGSLIGVLSALLVYFAIPVHSVPYQETEESSTAKWNTQSLNLPS